MSTLQQLADRIVAAGFEKGVEKLSAKDRVFFLVWGYAGELANGGHEQFFFNATGDHTQETIDALKEAGLPRFAALLSRAAAAVFAGPVPRLGSERNEVMDNLPDRVTTKLEKLDDSFFSAGGDDRVYERLEKWYAR